MGLLGGAPVKWLRRWLRGSFVCYFQYHTVTGMALSAKIRTVFCRLVGQSNCLRRYCSFVFLLFGARYTSQEIATVERRINRWTRAAAGAPHNLLGAAEGVRQLVALARECSRMFHPKEEKARQ